MGTHGSQSSIFEPQFRQRLGNRSTGMGRQNRWTLEAVNERLRGSRVRVNQVKQSLYLRATLPPKSGEAFSTAAAHTDRSVHS